MRKIAETPFLYICIFFCIFSVYTCKKLEKSMMVSTEEVTNIQKTSAVASGIVVDLGESASQHGHYYGTSPNITTAGTKTQLGAPPSGTFTSQLSNLTAGTKYYVKAYISDGSEVVYGKEISFTTQAATVALVTTAGFTDVAATSATSGGNITDDGGTSVTERGVCWNTTGGPTTDDNKTIDGAGTGTYSSNMSGLIPGTTYYVRAYATNSAGTAYGDELSFSTPLTLPTLTTTGITEISLNSASSGGNITSNGGSAVTISGICWNSTGGPTTTDSKTTDGSVSGSFASNLSGLTANTTYYVRAYATNSVGTAYGSEISFTTSSVSPVVATLTTTAASSITQTTASSGGNITSNGGATITVSGVCWSTAAGPVATGSHTTDGATTGTFTSSITGLTANTKYYYRAYATNSAGTAYGDELSFTTLSSSATPPTAAVAAATALTNTTATMNGAVNANGTSTTVTFEYGSTTLYGSSIDATPSVVTGTATTSVSAALTGLTPGTLIHYRVKTVNAGGTAYSTDLTFTTTQVPDAITEPATLITTVSATINATVNANSLPTTVTFEYGTSIGYGSTATAVPNPVSGGSPSAVSYGLTGLLPKTTYHYRIKAVSTGGTIYGEDKTFSTLCTSPAANTNSSTLIDAGGATLNGTVNANGFSTVVTFEYGLTNTYGNNIIAAQSPVTGSTNVDVNAAVTGLTSNTLYHYAVKAVNCSPAPVYGDDITFTTLATVTTGTITDITTTSASCGGDVDLNFGPEDVTSRGVCWSTSPNPTTANDNTIDGSGFGTFTSNLSALNPNTIYYVRAYAINAGGTAYGNQQIFTTLASVTTTAISGITTSNAASGGTIATGGGAAISSRGVCWGTISDPTITSDKTSDGTGDGSFTSSLSALTSNTKYYVRAYATNAGGTSYGNQITFTTQASVTTTSVSNIKNISASGGGTVTVGGGESVTARGVCWSTSINPIIADNKTTNGAGTGAYTSSLTNLTRSTIYYVRAYATNAGGTSYGNQVSFTSALCPATLLINHLAGSVSPVDKTVNYGIVESNLTGDNKCWITQNLGADYQAVSATDNSEQAAGWYWQFNRKQGFKFVIGIPSVRTPSTTWITSISESSGWTAANDPCTSLLGSGWRIPTYLEWVNVFANGVSGSANFILIYNTVLKIHEAGFLLEASGTIQGRGSAGTYWSNTQKDNTTSYGVGYDALGGMVGSGHNKARGYTIRCIQD